MRKVIFLFIVSLASAHVVTAQNVAKRFPAERKMFKDSVTGRPVTALTTSLVSDTKIYQTHPQWTADGVYVIFRSGRSNGQVFAVHEKDGSIIQLTDGKGINTGSLNVCRHSNRVLYLRNNRLTAYSLDPVFAAAKQNKLLDSAAQERVIMELPALHKESGGFTLDANDSTAYIGISYKKENDTAVYYKLCAIDLQGGKMRTIIDIPFRVGHVQANPYVTGEILYCQETGGDAEQRMWMVNADGTGNRPFYKETKDEWVTHEIWADSNHVMVNVLGHLARLRTKPHGLAEIDVRTNEIRFFKNAPGRGYWHSAESPDRKWAIADTFTGELHRINLSSGEVTVLATGLYEKTDGIPNIHSHHTISPDGKRVLFNSGRFGNNDLMVMDIE